MSYMGDRKSSKQPIEHAKKMLRNLMIAPAGLRDEVYMQLCKQTTQNPKLESTMKGWELMLFCLATFPPRFDFSLVGSSDPTFAVQQAPQDLPDRLHREALEGHYPAQGAGAGQ